MRLRRITTLVALAAVVSIAAAAEGQAGGGTPIWLCAQVVTTNAFLAADMDCPGSHGIVVGADGITIDLKGLTIRGDRTVATYGVANPAGHDRVTIKNGTVSNFYRGVAAAGDADEVSVSNVLASGNDVAGIHVAGDSASVKSTTAVGNDGSGVLVVGDSARIKSSTVAGNGVIGISVLGEAAQLKGNRALGNGFGSPDSLGAGIQVTSFTTSPPVGKNVARGNDYPDECSPITLC
jgi:hypothetical protein